MPNALYYGDNLSVLRESIATESVAFPGCPQYSAPKMADATIAGHSAGKIATFLC